MTKSSQSNRSVATLSQHNVTNNSRVEKARSAAKTSAAARSRNFEALGKSRSQNSATKLNNKSVELLSGDSRAAQNRSVRQESALGVMKNPPFPTRLDDQIIPILTTLDSNMAPPERLATYKLTEPPLIKPLISKGKVPKRKSLVIQVGSLQS